MGLLLFSTLLLPQLWYMYLRWKIPSLRAPLLDKRTPSFPNDKHCTEGFGFTNTGFSKSLSNLVWSCNSPLTRKQCSNYDFANNPLEWLVTLLSARWHYCAASFIFGTNKSITCSVFIGKNRYRPINAYYWLESFFINGIYIW